MIRGKQVIFHIVNSNLKVPNLSDRTVSIIIKYRHNLLLIMFPLGEQTVVFNFNHPKKKKKIEYIIRRRG